MNTVTYYVCVVNEFGPEKDRGKLLGDYDFPTKDPKWATLYTERSIAEKRTAGKAHISVVPLTMVW